MNRPHHLATTITALLLAVTLVSTSYPGSDSSSSGSWGSSLAIHDPDPGFWRAGPGETAVSAQEYSVGMSSLAAMTRLKVAPGHDLELTNLGTSGAILLESGALVLTTAEGSVVLRRAGQTARHDPAPAGASDMLMRGDRILFHSSATVAFRNPEATDATLLLATEIPDLPFPAQEVRAARDGAAHCPDGTWRGPLQLTSRY